MNRPDVRIIDATLREGCQAPGVRFSPQQAILVAQGLAALDVDQIECGHPAASTDDFERTRQTAALGLRPVLGHARAREDDIDAVAAAGATWVGVFLGVNEYARKYKVPGATPEDLLRRIAQSVGHARRRGLAVRYTAEDASRTEPSVVLEAFRAAVEAGASRVCFADTVGVLEPPQVAEWVRRIKQELPTADLELHLHDDRGLAIANALAGIDAGADWVSTSVNGLGERTGITDLCQLLPNLWYRGQRPAPSAGRALQDLSRRVAAFSRAHPDARRPVTGRAAFTHTSRLHVKAAEQDEMAYSWVSPEAVGVTTKFASPGLPPVEGLVVKPQAIPATELRYHREGHGVRHVMLDDRFVTDCRQYCIVREIPPVAEPPSPHVDEHSHTVDSLFVFLGNQPGLMGLRVEVVLGPITRELDSPASVFIPAGVPHRYRILSGSGVFFNHVLAGTYAESLLEPQE